MHIIPVQLRCSICVWLAGLDNRKFCPEPKLAQKLGLGPKFIINNCVARSCKNTTKQILLSIHEKLMYSSMKWSPFSNPLTHIIMNELSTKAHSKREATVESNAIAKAIKYVFITPANINFYYLCIGINHEF